MSVAELENSVHAIEAFDVLATVKMIQSDINEHGAVKTETLEQIYDEELSYIVEALDKPHTTRFVINYDSAENDFYNKRRDSLTESYKKGHKTAQKNAEINPIYKFHEFRCSQDVHELEDVKKLMLRGEPGESVVVLSPFPEEAFRAYGKNNLESIGYQPNRLMGFIRINKKIDESRVEVISIRIDNSDLGAFKEVAKSIGVDIPAITSSEMFLKYRALTVTSEQELVDTYDKSMSQKYGGQFSAGRRKIGEQNGWEFINGQKNLCDFYFSELQQLALRSNLSETERALAKTALTVGFWARLKEVETAPIQAGADMASEVYGALERAEARYEVMIGCGGSMPATLLENSKANIFSLIFSTGSESFVWAKGKCRVKQCPSRPKTTIVGPCSVCVGCQHLFDKGKNPTNEYKKLKPKNKWQKNKPNPDPRYKLLI